MRLPTDGAFAFSSWSTTSQANARHLSLTPRWAAFLSLTSSTYKPDRSARTAGTGCTTALPDQRGGNSRAAAVGKPDSGLRRGYRRASPVAGGRSAPAQGIIMRRRDDAIESICAALNQDWLISQKRAASQAVSENCTSRICTAPTRTGLIKTSALE